MNLSLLCEEGVKVPEPQTYDLVLQAVDRTLNGKKIAADKAGVAVTDRSFINVACINSITVGRFSHPSVRHWG